ncbi:MAG: tRNA guanosine(34) transglycosylase Tgt [Phycisphaerales bacterium]
MSAPLEFTISQRSKVSRARSGVVRTLHGEFPTPAFMPVGTKGTIKGILPSDVARIGARIVLGNTYHLLLRPGAETVAQLGGLHAMMGWAGPILTDSGGYQAYSMADNNAIDDDGVSFRSIVDGSEVRLTPESATRAQNLIGADIIMAFDDCPPSVDPDAGPVNQTRLRLAAMRDAPNASGYDHAARLDLANERTVRWLERCKHAHARPDEQALFGIVQGGTDLDRRSRSAEQVCNIDLPGYAIGGVAVGEGPEDIARVTAFTAERMPEGKPRYLMGVGYERDIVGAVLAGVDMFDCVLPTRNGRSAWAFTREGPLRLRNAAHAHDTRPIEPGCDCPACDPSGGGVHGGAGAFSRAYLRHLFASDEMLGPILVSLHNLRHFQRLMSDLRGAIATDDWARFASSWPVAAGAVPPSLLEAAEGRRASPHSGG